MIMAQRSKYLKIFVISVLELISLSVNMPY